MVADTAGGGAASASALPNNTPAAPAPADPSKPTVLLILSSVRGDPTPTWTRVLSRFNVLHYDCGTPDEFAAQLRPGGRYAGIDAIVRTGWLKAGPYAGHQLFRGAALLAAYPPSLRYVGCSGHGHDAADVAALAARGVAYANTPDTCTDAVANTALYLLLAAYRAFSFAERCARADDGWPASRAVGPVATDPAGQVLGVVGLGDIGAALARKAAAALGMRVHYHNRRRCRPEVEATVPGGAVYHDSLASLAAAADCLCLACPLTEATRHLLSGAFFERLGPGKRIRIVNIARGGLIDEEALLAAMERGQVVGVGLDVHANEPGVNPRLKDNYWVTVLPHIGVASRTTWNQFDEVNLRNLEEFFFGDKKKVTIVNGVE
ncbi:glyoxylate reductase [Xylariomycetidae sp. FL0641]|nr:glyoxylate reductase [Xylariomycetidae sp. FL0641]